MAAAMLALATCMGGGSLLLFGIFLFFGPLHLVHMGWANPAAFAFDGFLSLLFFAQHSCMLRRGFRARLESFLPSHYHGSLYAIASGVVLTALVILWQPSPTWVFQLEGLPRVLVRALFIAALAGMAWGALALGTFDPLGLEALSARARKREPPPHALAIRGPYRWVRHPLYLFSILLIWLSPDVTADRLLFDLLWTAWIYGATYLEEADLVAEFGEAYRVYQHRVPRLLPWKWPAGDGAARS